MANKNAQIVSKNVLYVGMFLAVALLAGVYGKRYFVKNMVLVERPGVDAQGSMSPSPTLQPTIVPQVIQPEVPKPALPEGWTEYVNEEFGYSIAYPKFVTVGKYSYNMFVLEEGVNTSTIVAKGIDGLGSVTVTKKSLNEVLKDRASFNKNQSAATKITKQDNYSLNGYQAIRLVTEGTFGEERLQTIEFLIENNGRVYILVWGSFDMNSNLSYEAMGDTIFKTFHLN
ncbi:hypothetical protein KA082_00975 [Candidatus Woesebacteria bacterium]|nr:hypothetical protein [Candidatus Woesebacteria bacterium]